MNMDEEPQVGVHSEKDVEDKKAFGVFYDALRELVDIENNAGLKPWGDLNPEVQYLFCMMLGTPPSPAHDALQILSSFIDFVNSNVGENSAAAVALLNR
jgi:hypothetical protein